MLLQTQQLTKDYGTFRALDRLDLAVAPGEIVGILGPNGSGKSTALRIILGLLRPTSGRAAVGGHDCWVESVRARKLVSYLPGELRLYENMTGRQLVTFFIELRGQRPNGRIDQLARTYDIDLARPIAQLSSGMKRKLALMAVLLPQTPLVILDEPTNTLDPTMRDELLDQILEAGRQGQAIVFSSHVLSEVERVCNRVAILQRGRLVHLQCMQELQSGRQVRVQFAAAPPLPNLAGLVQTKVGDAKTCHYEFRGPLPALLQWLSTQEVTDLQIEPLGLSSIYQQFHP